MNQNEQHKTRIELTIEPGERRAICRCWQSQKMPFCDGSHRRWNEENKDNIGPAVVISSASAVDLDE